MKKIIDTLDDDLELIKMIPQFDLNESFADNIVGRLANKSLQKKIKGENFTYPILATILILGILTFSSIFLTTKTDESYAYSRNYYLKSVATSYSIDYTNNYYITN